MMSQLMQTIRGAFLLEDEAFVRIRDAEDAFARGLKTIVVISLIVGLVLSAVSYVSAARTTPAQEMEAFREGMENVAEQMRAFGAFGEDEEAGRAFSENFEAGLGLGQRVVDAVVTTTPAPMSVVELFQALGGWLSYPFGWISTWMFYGALTLIFARLLGGTASIRDMLATTSLVAVPHLLDAFTFIPYVGGLIGFLAFVWGLAVYVKGTAIANRFDLGRGALAAFAPIITLLVLISILIFSIILLIVIGS